MDRPKIRVKNQPESEIRGRIINMLTLKGWYVRKTHGNAFSDGWPDLFATHKMYGHRWIEVKLPEMKGSKFTPAQIKDFPMFIAFGSGIWVLTGDSETEYKKLFGPTNYWTYL